MKSNLSNIIVIAGTNASGKSSLAIGLGEKIWRGNRFSRIQGRFTEALIFAAEK